MYSGAACFHCRPEEDQRDQNISEYRIKVSHSCLMRRNHFRLWRETDNREKTSHKVIFGTTCRWRLKLMYVTLLAKRITAGWLHLHRHVLMSSCTSKPNWRWLWRCRATGPSLKHQNQLRSRYTSKCKGPEHPHLLSPSTPAPPQTLSEHPTLACAFSKAASLPPPSPWALGLWLGQAGTAVPGAVLSQAVRVTATHTS